MSPSTVGLAGYPVAITVHSFTVARRALMDRCSTSCAGFITARVKDRILHPGLLFGGCDQAAPWQKLSDLVRIGNRHAADKNTDPSKGGEGYEFGRLKTGFPSFFGTIVLAKPNRLRPERLLKTHDCARGANAPR